MKVICFLIFVAFAFHVKVLSQPESGVKETWQVDVLKENANYYEITKKWDRIFETNPEIKADKEFGYKNYLRWKIFYQTRVNYSDKQPGKLHYANEVYSKFKRPAALKSGTMSNWNQYGPDTMTWQHMGIVVSMAFDKLHPDTIFAGTNASGVWRTYNGEIIGRVLLII